MIYFPIIDTERLTTMEFNQKLQSLRKQKGLTQEDLAEILCVSRAAVSKWESGRGFPNIDSLKAISSFFSVSIDELLSSNEALTIAEQNHKQELNRHRDLIFGVLDCSTVLLFFLPFFAQRFENVITAVSFSALIEVSFYLKVCYGILLVGTIAFGVFLLATQNFQNTFRNNYKLKISLILNTVFLMLLICSLQPYASAFLFTILICKSLLLIKW